MCDDKGIAMIGPKLRSNWENDDDDELCAKCVGWFHFTIAVES